MLKQILAKAFPTFEARLRGSCGQRSTGTFPTGLPDGEIMLENPREGPKGMNMRKITEYRPVPGGPEVFLTLFPRREGLPGTSISASRFQNLEGQTDPWPIKNIREGRTSNLSTSHFMQKWSTVMIFKPRSICGKRNL